MTRYTKIRDDDRFRNNWILFPDDYLRGKWDIILLILLTYAATIIPFRISFIENDDEEWVICDYVVDSLFMFDIIVVFFSAYYDREENLIINKKVTL